jgi:hypothetical protein
MPAPPPSHFAALLKICCSPVGMILLALVSIGTNKVFVPNEEKEAAKEIYRKSICFKKKLLQK